MPNCKTRFVGWIIPHDWKSILVYPPQLSDGAGGCWAGHQVMECRTCGERMSGGIWAASQNWDNKLWSWMRAATSEETIEAFKVFERESNMKKLMTIAVLLACLMAPASLAQNSNDDTVTVKKSDLNASQLATVQAREASEKVAQAQKTVDGKIEQYGKWVGIGHELGSAVNESLSAVTTQANNFAQTGVGKWTIALVVYKVIGRDLLGFGIGLTMLFFGSLVWFYSFYKNCIPHRVLISEDKATGKKWQVVNENNERGMPEQRWGHVAVLVGYIAICMIIMFS